MMTSALINVYDKNKTLYKCRALLDTCATANFITNKCLKSLQLQKTKCMFNISTLNDVSVSVNHSVQLTFRSLYNNFEKTINCLVVPSISNNIPSEFIPRELIEIPKNLQLADPQFYKPAPIDILLGAGPTLSVFSLGQLNFTKDNLDFYFQKTRLGWIIGGSFIGQENIKENANCFISNIQNDIERFWLIEEIPQSSETVIKDLDSENHFKKFTRRNNLGQYVVALPFQSNLSKLGNSRERALNRLNQLFKKFEKNPILQKNYSTVIQEYIDLNHMSEIKIDSNSIDRGYYLPHHAVIKESSHTTKTRVVFDASAKSTTNLSLNDVLQKGSTTSLQPTIFSLLLYNRTVNYVILGDIVQMYRNFLVREEDRDYLKILWKVENEIKEFRMNTITFGLGPAAFLAIRCLIQLAEDEKSEFPIGAEMLKSFFYVDNLIAGSDNINEIKQIYEQVNGIMNRACLKMRQWATNAPGVLDDVEKIDLDKNFLSNDDDAIKTLGVYWKSRSDIFIYKINVNNNTPKITKRFILSEVAKIYDPLGLLGPVILYAKVIIQELWQSKISWDESVPTDLYTKWTNFYNQLILLEKISLRRKVLISNPRKIELHGFSDASERGYGACIYIRSTNANGNVFCYLLCSKSRVAPLKKLTIPKLELCGALLLVTLYKEVIKSIKLKFSQTVFWIDSEIVLHWLNTSSNNLKTFVSNRVSEIQNSTDISQWRHVRSAFNPADALSRGQLPTDFLKNETWFNGPTWLKDSESEWPISHFQSKSTNLPEIRELSCFVSTSECDILSKFSSFKKLKRVIAYCYRFLPKFRSKSRLTVDELDHAEIIIIRLIQKTQFFDEIQKLDTKKPISKSSRIRNLDPFLDENRVLRVGGRLQNSNLSYSCRHPIILPRRNFVTDLIIEDYHVTNLHTGIQTTLYNLRQKYWPIDGRNQIKKIIRKCVNCYKFNPKVFDYKMGSLPEVRVIRSRPFVNTGMDFCGPFYIKEKKFRNRTKIKVYVCVFVCMSVKAVHLEVVSDLTTEAFLGALRRFISRRGRPKNLYSDNGTNFVGAKNELNDLYVFLQSESNNNIMNNFCTNRNINFHFIPPAAPFFGGLWESSVKSMKIHFKRTLANFLLTYEQFESYIIEIEAVLNSRPLVPLSNDPNDLLVLTPAHFLIGTTFTSLPEKDLNELPYNRLSAWNLVVQLRQEFWNRWSKEYLNELTIRQKWFSPSTSAKIGMLVLIKDENLPSFQWPLARITAIHPGNDGIVRTVTLKTSTGALDRPVKKLAPLPIIDNQIPEC